MGATRKLQDTQCMIQWNNIHMISGIVVSVAASWKEGRGSDSRPGTFLYGVNMLSLCLLSGFLPKRNSTSVVSVMRYLWFGSGGK